MQMIFQDPYSSLNPRKTVGSIIGEPFIIHGIERDEGKRKKMVQELMDRVGLNPEHYNRFPHEFSGGQRQRIGVARAIALKPKLIVADEPVSALDVSIQAQIINLLRELQRELGLTIVFIAHDLSVVRHVCDRVAVMYLGKIVELAEADELFDHPRHPYTGALLSAVPVPDPRLAKGKQRQVLGGDVPSPTNPPKACRFHTRCPKAQDGVCNVDEPLLETKEGGNVAACHFPLTDEEIAQAGADRARHERRIARGFAGVRDFPKGTRTAADAAAASAARSARSASRWCSARGRRRRGGAGHRLGRQPRRRGARWRVVKADADFVRARPASRSAACRRSATRAPLETVVDEDLLATRRLGGRGHAAWCSRSRRPSWWSAPAGACSASGPTAAGLSPAS